jgi:hypothetical protein
MFSGTREENIEEGASLGATVRTRACSLCKAE